MKNVLSITFLAGVAHLLIVLPSNAQKKVSELSLIYDYSAGAAVKGSQAGTNEYAVHSVYIKGSKSRSEMTTPLFSSTILFDANTGFAVILKEVSGQKLLIRLNPENWVERNRGYQGLVFKNTSETKDIAGYKCIKAVGQTKSGITLTVFYTRDLIPENKEYDPAFKNLEGLPLEYELTNGDIQIRYRISKINLNPVPASKFDIPRTGYREMNYEESKKLNIGG
jgi:GLPGLI family protein